MTTLTAPDNRSTAKINLSALQHNLQRVRTFAPTSSILAMVKADAYGHGLLSSVRALNAADACGVHCLKEALLLRSEGVKKRIVLMVGFVSKDELPIISKEHLDVVIHDEFQLKALLEARLTHPLTIWLKVDTGMHRLGFLPEPAKTVYQQLISCNNVCSPIHLLTHFASADKDNDETTQSQIAKFYTLNLSGPKSLANSAGIIKWPMAHADWVRPGIMLYGVSPFEENVGLDHDLRPVMTLTSRLIAIHEFHRGDKIGYGGEWTCPEDMRVGVVAFGYGDGYPRHAKNGTPVIVNGEPCALVGRVSMDMITVDLRTCLNPQVGDEAILWGETLPVEIIARYANTIAYELLCNVAKRVDFIYENENAY